MSIENISPLELVAMRRLMERHEQQTGRGLKVDEFIESVGPMLSETTVEARVDVLGKLFELADSDQSGTITWEDVSDYIYHLKEATQASQAREDWRMLDPEQKRPHMAGNASHTEPVERIRYFPELDRFATASRDGTVRLWHGQTLAPQGVLSAGSAHVTDVVYLHERCVLVACSQDGILTLWRIRKGHIFLLGRLRGPNVSVGIPYSLCAVEMPRIRSTFAFGDTCGEVRLYKGGFSELQEQMHLSQQGSHSRDNAPIDCMKFTVLDKSHRDWVTCLISVPDYRFLVTSSLDGTIRVLHLEQGVCIRQLNIHSKGVHGMLHMPERSAIASWGVEWDVLVWHVDPVDPGQINATVPGHMPVQDVTYVPRSRQMAVLYPDFQIKLFSLGSGEPKVEQIVADPKVFPTFADRKPVAMALDPVRNRVLTAANRPVPFPIRLVAKVSEGHNSPVAALAYSHTFNAAITGDNDANVIVWDLDTGAVQYRLNQVHRGQRITAVALDPTHRRLLTGTNCGQLRMWSFTSGQLLTEYIHPHADSEVMVCQMCSQDAKGQGGWVVYGGWRGALLAWPEVPGLEQNTQFRSLPGHKSDVLCMDYDPGQNLLYTGDQSGKIIVWTLSNFSKKLTFLHTEVLGAAMASDMSCEHMVLMSPGGRPRQRDFFGSSGRALLKAASRLAEDNAQRSFRQFAMGDINALNREASFCGDIAEDDLEGESSVESPERSPRVKKMFRQRSSLEMQKSIPERKPTQKLLSHPSFIAAAVRENAGGPGLLTLVTATADGRVLLWRLIGLVPCLISVVKGSVSRHHAVSAMAADSSRAHLLAVGDSTGAIRIWEFVDARPSAEVTGPPSFLLVGIGGSKDPLLFSVDGRLVGKFCADRKWDIHDESTWMMPDVESVIPAVDDEEIDAYDDLGAEASRLSDVGPSAADLGMELPFIGPVKSEPAVASERELSRIPSWVQTRGFGSDLMRLPQIPGTGQPSLSLEKSWGGGIGKEKSSVSFMLPEERTRPGLQKSTSHLSTISRTSAIRGLRRRRKDELDAVDKAIARATMVRSELEVRLRTEREAERERMEESANSRLADGAVDGLDTDGMDTQSMPVLPNLTGDGLDEETSTLSTGTATAAEIAAHRSRMTLLYGKNRAAAAVATGPSRSGPAQMTGAAASSLYTVPGRRRPGKMIGTFQQMPLPKLTVVPSMSEFLASTRGKKRDVPKRKPVGKKGDRRMQMQDVEVDDSWLEEVEQRRAETPTMETMIGLDADWRAKIKQRVAAEQQRKQQRMGKTRSKRFGSIVHAATAVRHGFGGSHDGPSLPRVSEKHEEGDPGHSMRSSRQSLSRTPSELHGSPSLAQQPSTALARNHSLARTTTVDSVAGPSAFMRVSTVQEEPASPHGTERQSRAEKLAAARAVAGGRDSLPGGKKKKKGLHEMPEPSSYFKQYQQLLKQSADKFKHKERVRRRTEQKLALDRAKLERPLNPGEIAPQLSIHESLLLDAVDSAATGTEEEAGEETRKSPHPHEDDGMSMHNPESRRPTQHGILDLEELNAKNERMAVANAAVGAFMSSSNDVDLAANMRKLITQVEAGVGDPALLPEWYRDDHSKEKRDWVSRNGPRKISREEIEERVQRKAVMRASSRTQGLGGPSFTYKGL
ncbi:unnamed protein product [Pedinophyceae sp. YPF-701]|nr:unnamed protein product [Pedinophyceae sp. YPF-701]